MTAIPVYIVANIAITDVDPYRQYEKGFWGVFKRHSGEIIAVDDHSVTLEGDTPRSDRMIILKFPSGQAAKDWYADPEYQTLSEYRRAGTKLEFLTMVHGMPAH